MIVYTIAIDAMMRVAFLGWALRSDHPPPRAARTNARPAWKQGVDAVCMGLFSARSAVEKYRRLLEYINGKADVQV